VKQSQATITARRQQVAALWLRGLNPTRIAMHVNASRGTVERDIAAVREDLTRASVATLEGKAARSVASLRLVQAEAWSLFSRLDDKSNSKIGALNTVANTEATIARIEGTLSGDYVTQQTINVIGGAEWQMLRGLVLHALDAHPDARRDVVAALLEAQADAHQKGGDESDDSDQDEQDEPDDEQDTDDDDNDVSG
jgi:hypothetical protein